MSVVVITKDRPAYLKKCLKSLSNQNFPIDLFEVIVVDGGDAFEVIRSVDRCFNVIYVKQLGHGIPQARNMGIKRAHGEIIAFIDDDCIADENWIKEGAQHFSNREIGIVQGKTLLGKIDFSIEECVRNYKLFFLGVKIVTPNWNYQTCNIFYRKKAIDLVGGFDKELKAGEDTDLAFRVKVNGYKSVFTDKAIVYHSVIPVDFPSLIKYCSQAYYMPLLVKKHPDLRKRIFLRFFWTSHDFLFTVALLSLIFAILFSPIFSIFIAVYFTRAFLGINHITNFVSKKYRILYRIFIFPFFIIKDVYNLAFFIAGSLKHKCLVL